MRAGKRPGALAGATRAGNERRAAAGGVSDHSAKRNAPPPEADVVRLIIQPVWPDTAEQPRRAGLLLRWDVLSEAGEVILRASAWPFYEGAYALLCRGLSPDTSVTMRREGTTFDCFQPVALRVPAEAGRKRALRRRETALNPPKNRPCAGSGHPHPQRGRHPAFGVLNGTAKGGRADD